MKRKRTKLRRVSVLLDRAYLDWLSAECRCAVCAKLEHRTVSAMLFLIDPAHGPVNGRGSKGADNEAIPLCRHHHIEQHQLGWPAFEQKYGIDRAHEARAHYAAWLIAREGQARE